MQHATAKQIALLDSALRAQTKDEARAFVTQVAPLRPPHVDDVAETWARKQIAFWAGYFDRRIRARIEALYEQDHPLLGAASKNFSMEEILRLGAEMAPGPFPYLRRPAPYPDEP